ncbi:MAG: hypothetical protein ACXVJD_18375 [Mucilaginibacter sp.]
MEIQQKTNTEPAVSNPSQKKKEWVRPDIEVIGKNCVLSGPFNKTESYTLGGFHFNGYVS